MKQPSQYWGIHPLHPQQEMCAMMGIEGKEERDKPYGTPLGILDVQAGSWG